MEGENVFERAMIHSRFLEFFTSMSWEFQGKNEEMGIDLFRSKNTGKKSFVEEIYEDFPDDLSYWQA